ncbi:DUF7344 domain-containing protein [Haloprofundus halophilus]|uniref:DUF7344 domain-containing protein n=1 Tax=Haloprofundus halophilus TaxID=2283527 RepID=UPI000E448137|nr:hypothetical protein [Haloprofundus halophilus]
MTANLGSPTEERTTSGLRDRRAVELFDALSDERRLWAADRLFEANGPVSLAMLARVLTAIEMGTELEDQTRESSPAYINLHHSHVPKLVRADVVNYDEERQTVELVDRVEPVGRVELVPSMVTFFVERGVDTPN